MRPGNGTPEGDSNAIHPHFSHPSRAETAWHHRTMASLRGHALIGQSGGPTAVINQSLVGLVERCVEHRDIDGVYGALNGIRGIMEERLIDLGRESREELEKVAMTPAAALA